MRTEWTFLRERRWFFKPEQPGLAVAKRAVLRRHSADRLEALGLQGRLDIRRKPAPLPAGRQQERLSRPKVRPPSPVLGPAGRPRGSPCPAKASPHPARGGALLAVLWLVAALSAIAFSIAGSVRGEIERATTALDGVRAYYLASGAVDRALLYMMWAAQYPSRDQTPRYYARWMHTLVLPFPTGEAVVEIIPENAKLNINTAPPEVLHRLLVALGAEPERATEIALAIQDWRSAPLQAGPTVFDQFYLSRTPSFRSRHASFEEIEELLLVKGMTPELFHGSYKRDSQGRLIAAGGLKDCVTVYSSGDRIDVNTAHPAVLAAVGLDGGRIAAILEARSSQPFRTPEQLAGFGLGPASSRLGIGGNSIFTLRATARLRQPGGTLSDLRRTVAATVQIRGAAGDPPVTVLRWQDQAWVQ